jgi:hypothetical protein
MMPSPFLWALCLILLILLGSAAYRFGPDLLKLVGRKSGIGWSGKTSGPTHNEPRLTAPAPSILCVAGEFSGSRLAVGLRGLIIGRSAAKCNVVLSSLEVSAAHARVWADAEGRVWVEDISSSNGTFYCLPKPGEVPEWIQISKPMALTSGTRFRLGENVAEFVVT